MNDGKSKKNELRLSPVLVRDLASDIPECYELKTKVHNTVSFIVTSASSSKDNSKKGPARVQVYCKTGTVGICRVLNQQVRVTFQQRCNLRAVERLLRQPPELTFINPEALHVNNTQLSGSTGHGRKNPNEQNSHVISDVVTNDKVINEQKKNDILLRDAESVDIVLAIIAGQRQNLISHVTSFRLEKERENELLRKSTKIRKNTNLVPFGSTAVRGKRKNKVIVNIKTAECKKRMNKANEAIREVAYRLPSNSVKEVEECLKENNNHDAIVCIATSGLQSFFLRKSGKWATNSSTLKKLLKNKKIIKYVSLGTSGRYFILFEGGEILWDGPNAMKQYVDGNVGVKCVAFGGKRDTFFVVYNDGSWKFEGSEIPQALKNVLSDSGGRDLTCVTIGPGGEWFLKLRDGRLWWGGVSKKINKLFHTLLNVKNKKLPHFIDFGKGGSFIMTYG